MQFSSRQRVLSWVRKTKARMLNRQLAFGKNVYVGPDCSINAIYKLEIGSNVYIGKRVTIEIEGRIGSGVIIGNNVGIIGRRDHEVDSFHEDFFFGRTVRENRSQSLPTEIGDGCWIGYGAIILSGIRIGARSIVAAGAIVTDDVPPHSLVKGNRSQVSLRRR